MDQPNGRASGTAEPDYIKPEIDRLLALKEPLTVKDVTDILIRAHLRIMQHPPTKQARWQAVKSLWEGVVKGVLPGGKIADREEPVKTARETGVIMSKDEEAELNAQAEVLMREVDL